MRAQQLNPGVVINTPAGLDPAAVYRTPSGRVCRLVQMDGRRSSGDAVALFEYVSPRGHVNGGAPDGFALSRTNWRILERAW